MDLPRPFGPYTLQRRLAVGGMAEVYVAKAKGIGGFEKLVAIKVIHPRYSEDDHFVQMLVEEAKLSVLLTHVNVAQTFDLGCIDDTYFIVMELVEGADAYKLLKRAAERPAQVPLDLCAYIASEMCQGLDYAHRKRDMTGAPLRIVHRDISPQNVLVSFAGEVKIVDFGIAKAALRSANTEVGVIKGKYYYMSPEQAWADPVDHRSDIFSTGIVLHELLTGRMVYEEDNLPKLLDRVRKAEIPRPSKLRPEVPPELDEILTLAGCKRNDTKWDVWGAGYGASPAALGIAPCRYQPHWCPLSATDALDAPLQIRGSVPCVLPLRCPGFQAGFRFHPAPGDTRTPGQRRTLQCLRNKVLVFLGDSVMRELFTEW